MIEYTIVWYNVTRSVLRLGIWISGVWLRQILTREITFKVLSQGSDSESSSQGSDSGRFSGRFLRDNFKVGEVLILTRPQARARRHSLVTLFCVKSNNKKESWGTPRSMGSFPETSSCSNVVRMLLSKQITMVSMLFSKSKRWNLDYNNPYDVPLRGPR